MAKGYHHDMGKQTKWRGGQGKLFIKGHMTDALQRKMDADSRNGTFAVDPNHSAYARRYCEMCGGEVGRDGECIDQGSDMPTGEEMARVVNILCNWSMERPQALRVLANKLAHPADSIRDICDSYPGVTRWKVHKFLRELGEYWPGAKVILGFESTIARTQRKRREREKQCRTKQ